VNISIRFALSRTCVKLANWTGRALDSPDSAVEREVVSKEQTLRSEDNAFLPLIRRQVSVRCVTTLSKWRRRFKR
jgi:hypothetical protein